MVVFKNFCVQRQLKSILGVHLGEKTVNILSLSIQP